MKRLILAIVLLAPGAAQAHFLELRPSSTVVHAGDNRDVEVDIAFGHPFFGQRLDMAPLRQFRLVAPDGGADLASTLTVATPEPRASFAARHHPGATGDYIFTAESEPYWEPKEETYIWEIAKVVMNYGGEEGDWGQNLGLPVEIVPLSRPYAVWAGSTFTGQVFVDGKPAPGVTVEVTLARGADEITPASSLHDVATVKTDSNGVFTSAMPVAGWWGFSALTEAPNKLAGPDRTDRPVELDAVFWVHADNM